MHLDSQECSLYINRTNRTHFALSFDNKLLMMQAATEEDAHDWVVAIASCLYFCSQSFAELIEDCQRFFNAVPKSYDDGRLSVIEALDLLRAMGRTATLEQVEQCAQLAQVANRFDAREFAFLVRFVCSDVEPAGELLRSFKTFDPQGLGVVLADQLIAGLAQCGVPPEEIEPIVRAAGASPDGKIDYGMVVHSLYPNSIVFEDAPTGEADSASGSAKSLGTARSHTSSGTPRAVARSRRRSGSGVEEPAEEPEPVTEAERIVKQRKSDASRRASAQREDELRIKEAEELDQRRMQMEIERVDSLNLSLIHI